VLPALQQSQLAIDIASMPASKSIVAGSILVGASVASADAFVSASGPSQRGSPAALRGATETFHQSSSSSSAAYPATAAAAVGAMVLSSFAGSARRKASDFKRAPVTMRAFAKETQLGAQEPLGFWDPLNLCADEATFKDYRAKEIKHGRLAMMAALGMLAQSAVQVPGMEGVPKGVTACLVGNGQNGFLAILAVIAVLEAAVFVQDEKKEPGNFGNPLPWFDDYSAEMRARELNNGRIAMFSAIGIIAAGLYTGKPAIEQFGL